MIKFAAESAVAAGVRRLEAVTGEGARRQFNAVDKQVRDLASVLNVAPGDLVSRVETLLGERRALEKQLSDAKRQLAMGGGTTADAPKDVNGVKLLGKVVEGIGGKELKALADQGKQSISSGVVVFVGIDGTKAGVVVGVTEDLTDRFSAVDFVKLASTALGGQRWRWTSGYGTGWWPRYQQPAGPQLTQLSSR